MKAATESVEFQCRLCGHEGKADLHRAREMMFGSRERFDYVLCVGCGCLQIERIPDDLGRHYPPNYYSQASLEEPSAPSGVKGALIRWYCRSASLRPHSGWRATLRRCLPLPGDFMHVQAYLTGARLRRADERILDVGCGASPTTLAAMRRCGFEAVEGLDPFVPTDLEYHGIPVRKQTIEQAEGAFGLVMFHHSLEHVPDPQATMREAARLLRPGGCCLVRIPVLGGWFWRQFGTDWAELDAPRHLYLMSEQTLALLAERAGFAVRESYYDSTGWEIAASRQYAADVPLFDPRSYRSSGKDAMFARDDLLAFDSEAAKLNAARDGGRACFYLEKR